MPETSSLILACDRLQRHHALLRDGGLDLARDLDAVALPRRDQQLGAPGFDREQAVVGGKPLRAARRPPRSTTGMPLCGSRATLASNETGLAAGSSRHHLPPLPYRSGDRGDRKFDAARRQRRTAPGRQARDGRRAHSRRATPACGQDASSGRTLRLSAAASDRAVAAIDRLAIRHGTAIEHARQLLHPLGHAEIADAELANRMLDVGEERVGQVLRDVARVAPPRRAAGAGPGTCAAPSSRSARAACPEHSTRHKAPAAARPPRFARRGASVILRLAALPPPKMRLNMPDGFLRKWLLLAMLHRWTSWFTGFALRRKPLPGRD